MKIGIDARPFKYSEFSGIPYAIFEVIRRCMTDYPENEYYLISNSEINIPCEIPSNWKMVIEPAYLGNGTLWQIFRLTKIVKKLELDAYWGTNYMLPRKVKNCRYLLTVHDLAYEVMPKVVSWKTLLILKIFCRRACRDADFIHAVSKSTKEDIVERYSVDIKKIKVAYWGAPTLLNVSKRCVKKEIEELDCEFILVLGTLEPRKNIVNIARAFEKFKETDTRDIHIVYAGKWGWKFQEFKKVIESSNYKKYIHILEYVDEKQKYELLDRAKVLLYPSLYEGFGLPILEAYNHGLPVITCKNSSLPEVAGDAAVYISDVNDFNDICYTLKRFFGSDNLVTEKNYKAMGVQLNKFSWDNTTANIMRLLTD